MFIKLVLNKRKLKFFSFQKRYSIFVGILCSDAKIPEKEVTNMNILYEETQVWYEIIKSTISCLPLHKLLHNISVLKLYKLWSFEVEASLELLLNI